MRYIKSGHCKYLPDFLIPKYRPRIIEQIIKGEEVIGHILGINLKDINLNDETLLEEYIIKILKIKPIEEKILYIEDIEKYNKDVLDKIELKTSMKISTGEDLKLYNLPLVIEELLKYLKADINREEVLIICDHKQITIDIVSRLSKNIRFISIMGVDDTVREEIYNEILNSTGISLIQPINIEKTIKNYGMIINLSEKNLINLENVRRKAIIIDFSNSKNLTLGEKNINTNIVIEDINLDIVDSGIEKNPWFESRISSSLYESLMGSEKKEFCQIYSKNKFHYVKDLINKEIKIKGRM